MKVVVSCDAVLKRDYYLEIIESVLDVVGEQCELYALVHREGKIVGPVEQRKIHSSFLSHKVDSFSELTQHNFLIPGAAKNLFIPCSVDLIINISRGYSHGILKCEKTKQITFIVEDIDSQIKKKTFKQKIFSSFVKSFQAKSLSQVDKLWVSNLNLIPASLRDKATVVAPPVKLMDYKILPDALFVRDYFVVNAESLTVEEAKAYIGLGKKFKFIGSDDHLESLKVGHEECFFGDRCGGELAPLLAGAMFLIDHEQNEVPVNTLKTLASGRPVLGMPNQFISYGEGYYNLADFNLSDDVSIPEFDKNKARGLALAFEELKFKHMINRELMSLSPLTKVEQESDNCC
ncbi:hypothetical protein [Bacteriovorax sp. Seq25_V]|uniref:hypothetical protein n=1 Tax=Bacteriovorax sp. Seq25_V TaxID=1201288 RepID=UPI00038A41D5|nr:hypothetical protein [Bacteriovorax sp. Seq25_V]EQC43713.1 hypothetical protein M900_1347 [Bacteriovorax sp. Seq25_V]